MKATRYPYKYEFLLKELSKYLDGKVLDIGCDTAYLRNYCKNYVGVDISGKADIKLDLEKDELPFKTREFNCVLCLDVLEHLDNLHEILLRLAKITKKYLIISLPNEHYWRARLRFLFGRSNDREFGYYPYNRHKWVANYNQSKKFITKFARKNKLKIVEEKYQTVPDIFNILLPNTVYNGLRKKSPNFFTLTTFFVLEKY